MEKSRDTDFVNKHADMVFKLAASRTKDSSVAADVFQEVFYRYFKKRPVFTSDEHEKAWLIRVTINCSKSILTSFWQKRVLQLDETYTVQPSDDHGVYECVMQLPQKYRTVVFLFYYENLSIAEIARALHQNENTVKSHLHRARKMLKERLVDYDFS